jgi:hypothetical protein
MGNHADTDILFVPNYAHERQHGEYAHTVFPFTLAFHELYFFQYVCGNFVVTLKNNFHVRQSENETATEGGDLISFCETPRARGEIAAFLGKTTYYAMRSFVDPLLEKGKLKMTIPDKPRSRNQKYYS